MACGDLDCLRIVREAGRAYWAAGLYLVGIITLPNTLLLTVCGTYKAVQKCTPLQFLNVTFLGKAELPAV